MSIQSQVVDPKDKNVIIGFEDLGFSFDDTN